MQMVAVIGITAGTEHCREMRAGSCSDRGLECGRRGVRRVHPDRDRSPFREADPDEIDAIAEGVLGEFRAIALRAALVGRSDHQGRRSSLEEAGGLHGDHLRRPASQCFGHAAGHRGWWLNEHASRQSRQPDGVLDDAVAIARDGLRFEAYAQFAEDPATLGKLRLEGLHLSGFGQL